MGNKWYRANKGSKKDKGASTRIKKLQTLPLINKMISSTKFRFITHCFVMFS